MTSMQAPASGGLKQLVLRLAAAHPADRAWVLARLPDAARTRVAALLKELQALGIEDFTPWIGELAAPAAARVDATEAPHYWSALLLHSAQANQRPLAIEDQIRLEERAGLPPAGELPALPPALHNALHAELLAGDRRP